jgi:hypothetical protein
MQELVPEKLVLADFVIHPKAQEQAELSHSAPDSSVWATSRHGTIEQGFAPRLIG